MKVIGPFTHREMEKCAAREVAMRRNVFHRRGMTDDRRREIAIMETIAVHFKELADEEDRSFGAPGFAPRKD